jgi:Ca2+-binding EF-hand superfamily protein
VLLVLVGRLIFARGVEFDDKSVSSYLICYLLLNIIPITVFLSNHIQTMSSKPTDDQLRQAVEAIFSKYDADKSGTLEGSEVVKLISDAFKSLGRNKEASPEEINLFLKAVDKNGDGKISKA